MDRVRIGTLGAARITPAALIRPARNVGEAEVVAVAARDRARAEKFATKHRIPTVFRSYDELIAAPDIDAIYNPLPNGLHAQWTQAALEAGKHVLCEKPLTANAAEAEQLATVAQRAGLVLMEAFHWRYHPLAARMIEIVRNGELGTLQRVEAALCFPLPLFKDIRYNYDLAGGALMDAGCYTVHMVRSISGEEPEVVSATPTLRTPDIDRAMHAELRFPSGATGAITCSMWSSKLLKLQARAVGERGELRVFNPTTPQLYHRMKVTVDGRSRVERFPRKPTYEYQLEAFCAAVLRGEPTLTPPADSIGNMRVIDAIYREAGMKLRGFAT
ncbi:MAG TPA: Gfo/Idh/MocA family oxidoreductase [Acidimicrobiia bacterium]|nr:Gfo/Idh/MocA family oxidoreductase [Acidimicrobiia bacterium]